MKIVIALFSVMFLFNCTRDSISEQELMDYIKDSENGLSKRKDIKDGFIEINYKPIDLIIAQNYKNEVAEKGNLRSIRKTLSEYLYFSLRISKGGKEMESHFVSNQAEYQEMVRYMSHYMSEDISLQVEQGAYPVADYHYMSMFGTTEASTALIAFESKFIPKQGKFSVRLDGSKLGIGVHHFEFEKEDIEKIPNIKLF